MSIFDDMLKAADEAEKAAAATKPAAPVKPPPVATKPVAEGAVKAALPATPAVTEPAKPVKTDLEKIFAEGLAEADKAAKAAAKAAAARKEKVIVPKPVAATPAFKSVDWKVMYEASQIPAEKAIARRVAAQAALVEPGEVRSAGLVTGKLAPSPKPMTLEEVESNDVDLAVGVAAKKLGMSKDAFINAAETQGVSLRGLYRAAANKIPYEQVARASRERGVIGFMPPIEQEAAATRIANEALRAQRGEAADTPIALRQPGARTGVDFLGTSETLPEVTREGEHGYGIATLLVEALQKDPKAVRIFDRYSRMTTGGATQQYIDDRVEELAESKNLTPDTPGFDDKVKALRRQATREVIAYKTVGLWTPVIVLGETEVREGLRDPDLISAFKPGAEIIGFDNKNQAVFRQESALSTLLRAIDSPKSAVVEIGREVANKGIENADIAGAAARGVRAGTSLVEVSQNITEGAPLPIRVAAGAVGLAADIFSPDAVFVGGKAIRALTTAARGAGRVAEFAVLKSSAARGATKLAQEVVDLAETGDLAGAARKEAELRKQFPGVARAADQYDAFMARLIAAAYDDTRHLDNTLMDDIASIVPDAESPASRVGLHASQRFAEQAGKTKGGRRVSVLPYQEAYDVERHAQAIERDRARFLTQTPPNPEVYMVRFAGNYARNLVAPAVRGGAIKTTTANKVAAILKSEMPLLKADPKAWGDKIRATIKADADLGTGANKKLRETLYKRAIPAVQRHAAPVFTNYPAWYASQIQLFDDAQKAVSINRQSRIAGFKTVVRALNAGGYVDPIPEDAISILRGKLGSTAQPSLSTQGRAFFVDLLAASRRPQVSIEDAYQQAQVVDQAAEAWAKKNVSTVDEYYKRYGLRARRAQAPSPAPTPTPAPKPAAAVKPVARGKKAVKAAEVLEPTVPRAEVEPTVEVLEATVPRADVEATVPAAEKPVFPSIERDVRRADMDLRAKMRDAEIILGELYGRRVAAEWEEVPTQFRVNASNQINKALAGLDAGKITPEDFQVLVRKVATELEAKKIIARGRAATADVRRGADEVRARLLMAKAEFAISAEGADLADWFIQQNPRIAEGLGVVVGSPKYVGKRVGAAVGAETAGFYTDVDDLIALIKGRGNELTATHEVLHRTERMLPTDLQDAIRKEWAKRLTAAIETADAKDKPFLAALLTQAPSDRKKIAEAFKPGNLDPSRYYQFANPSEFWAVNASKIVSGRYAAFNAGMVAKAKQWLTEFAQKVKAIFGFQSDAPLLRGLDNVLKGEGTFVNQMMTEARVFRSVEAPPFATAADDLIRKLKNVDELTNEELLTELDGYNNFTLTRPYFEKRLAAATDDLARESVTRQLRLAVSQTRQRKAKELVARAELAEVARKVQEQLDARRTLDMDRVVPSVIPMSDEAKKTAVATRLWEGRTPVTAKGTIDLTEAESKLAEMPKLTQAVEYVRENTGNPFYKALAERLLRVGGRFDDASFGVAQAGQTVPSDVARALTGFYGLGGALGFTVSQKLADAPIRVWLRGSTIGGVGKASVEEVVLHEALHAATSERLFVGRYRAQKGTALYDAANNFLDLHQQVVEYVNTRRASGSASVYEADDFLSTTLNKPDEFLAYGMSDPEFQAYLATVPTRDAASPSLWTKFVDGVRSLIGLPASDTSALSRLIHASDKIMEIPEEAVTAARELANAPVSPAPIVSLMEAPADLAQAGKLAGDAERGAIDLSNKASVIIKLFRTADPSTALHEIGHLLRVTHLDDVDMASIASWLRSQGLNVGHRFGEFTGSATDVARAEEAFATAFEQFVREGVAPTADMKPALDALSGAVSAVYRGVANTPVGRALSPEARALFNKTLSAVDPEREVVRGIAQGQAAVKALEIPEGSLSYLSREAQRLGMPESTLEELAAKVDDVLPSIPKIGQKPAPAPSPSTVVIDFPAPVFGKTEYTLADLAKLDVELREKAALREATARPAKIDLRTGGEQVKGFTAAPGEIVEATPVERLRSAVAKRDDENAFVEGARTLVRGTVRLFFGGDVVTEKGLRDLPVTIRRDLSIIPRRIEQALVDSTLLVEDARKSGEIDNLIKYLAGSKAVATRGGRSLASSGDDMMGGFVGMIKRSFDGLTADQKQAVIELTATLNGPNRNSVLGGFGYDLNVAVELRRDVQGTKSDPLVEALEQLLYRPQLGDQNIDIGQSMYESIRQAVGATVKGPRPNYEFDLVESMLYTAGITSRNGKFIAGGSEEAARTFLKEASTIYQDDAVGRRLAVTIAGYGQAQIAKKRLAGLGLLMDEATVEAFKAWQVGGSVPVDMLPKVDELIRRVGQNPEFVRDPILDTTFYVPKQARELMADALTKVRVTTGSRDVGSDLLRSVLARRKTSMTRGTLVVKPRYFMMNTIDHYNQMAMIAGYGAAAQSAARVVMQDLMMVPYISQVVGVVARTGAISPTTLEKVRIGIQKGGDRVAWLIGAMFSASKYRIEVNPILEGARGIVRVGDKVYEQREIRNIAVEEGIFATFSSREFQKTIYAEGELFFDGKSFVTSGALGAKLPAGARKVVDTARDTAYALEDVVQDLAEAWSERERLGAMITLMEQGIPPRQAARLVIDALFDYSQSLSKGDRSMLLGAFFPFWSFQKNANTVVANLMLSSPEGAYRMMCIRRAQEGFAELASELMYGEVGGEYGVDVNNLPPDLQETYYSIISDVASAYPGKPIPEDVKSALRILFRGRTGNIVVEGKEVQLSPELLRLESSGAFRKFAMEGYAVPRPERSGLPSYLRDLPAITFPLERDASTRGYLSLLNDDEAYAALFIPENTISAGMKHMLGVTAGLVSLGSSGIDFISVGGLDTSDASNALEAAARAVQPALDIERTPLPMAIMSVAGVSGGAPGMKLDPWIGQLVQTTFDVSLVRAPAKYDAVIDKVMRGETEGIDPKIIAEIRELQKTNPDLATARDERYYLPSGLWTEAFRAVTSLYELNAFLLRLRTTPLEKANRQAYMLRWLRNVAGFTTAEVVPDKTARQEEPTRLKPTKEM